MDGTASGVLTVPALAPLSSARHLSYHVSFFPMSIATPAQSSSNQTLRIVGWSAVAGVDVDGVMFYGRHVGGWGDLA